MKADYEDLRYFQTQAIFESYQAMFERFVLLAEVNSLFQRNK